LGLLRLVVCSQIFDEVERNLQAKAPATLPYFQRLRTALNWEVVGDPTPEQIQDGLVVIDAKDAPILAAAIGAHPQHVETNLFALHGNSSLLYTCKCVRIFLTEQAS